MRRKSIAYLMAIVMLVTTFAFQFSAFAATDSGITVQFQNSNNSTSSNTIIGTYNVKNTGSSAVNLADLKLKYYYTKDADKALNFWCDHSGYMSGNNYIDVTSKVKGSFVKMSQTTSTADTCLEITFASDAGSLPAGGSITVQTRVARTDWSNFDQSNDYSFKASGSLVDWDHIVAYVGSTLKYGVEPNGGGQTTPNPKISPESATFDKGAPSDIAVTLTPDGATFNGITGLTKGTDYTVSGNTVTILKSKLAAYADGSTQKLTFDFGVSNNPVLSVAIKGIVVTDGLKVKLGTATGKAGDTVVVPVTLADVAKAGKVGTFGFNVNYDKTLLEAVKVEAGDTVVNPSVNFSSQINAGSISFLFLDNTIGSELIDKDGVVANITFKVLGTKETTTPVTFKDGAVFGDANMAKITNVALTAGSVKITIEPVVTVDLSAVIGTATGKAGDTVVVPVTLANVAKAGKVGTFGFNVNYDKTLLEAVKVEAGDTVVNAAVNFSSQINAGTISFLFLDNTIGSELIDKDGVVANITFKVLGTTETTTALTFKDGAVFGDANMAKIAKVTLTAGSVKITKDVVVVKDPAINPTTASFDKAAPADVAVTITENGNTFKGITGLTKDTDYTVSGNTVTILKSKLATYAKDSTQSFTFDFGVTNNPVLTVAIKDTTVIVTPTEALSAVIGTAEGKAGDTVVVPVTLANVVKAGKVGTFGFNVNYDKTLLEAVKVEAGDVVVNSAVNFSSQINAGSISFLFLDNTIGSELIDKDGVVAKITFKVLGTAAATTPVTFKDGSVFGNADMAGIAKVDLTNGSVAIKAGEVVVKDPAINPTTAKFEEGSASDLAVALTPNGNTFAGITGLTKDTDYTVSGDTVTIAKSYLNTLKAGDKVLSFNFGTKTVTLTITVTAKVVVEIKGLGVTVGTAAGKTGETVTIPVTLKNVEKAGKVGTFGFTLNYDSTLLEATKVEAGSIVLSPAVNFSSQIKAGSVTFLFLDNTIGDQLISSDGIVANVTFKVLGSSSVSAPVTFKDGAVFGDANMSKISDVTLAAGSVKLN